MPLHQSRWLSAAMAAVITLAVSFSALLPAAVPVSASSGISHVLLISVDGMHSVDLEKYVSSHPSSTLARLAGRGVRYPNASTSRPSDSFPGLLSIVTGGTPKSTGVYYDDSYDRSLVAPVELGGSPTGVTCTPGSTANPRGTEALFDETVDLDNTQVNGGGGINPSALPRDPKTCAPVYPHSFLKVNTIFEVLKAHGLRTAWSDKHLSYDLVNGPSGTGVDDLYNPEIVAPINVGNLTGLDPASSETAIQAYDNLKVQAIINEIDGLDHTGTTKVGYPAILGMNFQAVSVGQKLETDAITGQTGGYLDAAATPSPLLAGALDYVDGSLGRMVSELQKRGEFNSTLIIITAKHGQTPIDPTLTQKIGDQITPVVDTVGSNLIAQLTTDDVGLLWLTDRSQTAAVASALKAAGLTIGISNASQVLAGSPLYSLFGNPASSAMARVREPDIVVTPNLGVIYTHSTAKIAEHGGFSHDDTSVALLVSGVGLGGTVNSTPVTTTEIAPTIAATFGIDPSELQAVQQEGTTVLPQ